MRRYAVCFALLLASLSSSIAIAQQDLGNLTITILFDNYPSKEGLGTGWGFSCLIQGTKKAILFDIGSNVVLSNMEKTMRLLVSET